MFFFPYVYNFRYRLISSSTIINIIWSSFLKMTVQKPTVCGWGGDEVRAETPKMLFTRLTLIILTFYHPCSCFFSLVGKVGQNNLFSCGANLAQAKDTFKKKYAYTFYLIIFIISSYTSKRTDFKVLTFRFFDKTKNEWEHRASFEKVAGKYDMVFMDYSTEDKVWRHLFSQ